MGGPNPNKILLNKSREHPHLAWMPARWNVRRHSSKWQSHFNLMSLSVRPTQESNSPVILDTLYNCASKKVCISTTKQPKRVRNLTPLARVLLYCFPTPVNFLFFALFQIHASCNLCPQSTTNKKEKGNQRNRIHIII